MESFGVAAPDYLGRARARIVEGRAETLFYAALELRCAIEARQQEYLEAQEKYRKELPEAWRVRLQNRELQRVYQGKAIQRLEFVYEDGNQQVMHYVPVSNHLLQLVGKLDAYRHAQMKYHPPGDQWWETFSSRVLKCYRQTWVVLRGDLVSPALLGPANENGNKTFEMVQSLPADEREKLKFRVGTLSTVKVSYLNSAPAEWICDL